MTETKFPLVTQSACLDDQGNAWIFSDELNALFSLELESGRLRCRAIFDEMPFLTRAMYNEAVFYKGKIIFTPVHAKSIVVYVIATGEVRYIPIRDEDYLVYFNRVRIGKDRLLLYPVMYSAKAYLFDLEAETYETIPLDYGARNDAFSLCREKVLTLGSAYRDRKAYLSLCGTNEYLSFDVETGVVRFHRLKDSRPNYTAASDGQALFFLSLDGKTILRLKGEKEEMIDLPKAAEWDYLQNGTKMNYIFIDRIGGAILNRPLWGNPICLYRNNRLQIFPVGWEQVGPARRGHRPFASVTCGRDVVYLFSYESDTLLELRLETGELVYRKLLVTGEAYAGLCICGTNFSGRFSSQILGDTDLPLERFLDLISMYHGKLSGDGNVGRAIHRSMWEEEQKLCGKRFKT